MRMNVSRVLLSALLLLVAVTLFAPVTPAWAQFPSPSDPVGILDWLKLQGIAISLVVTIVWKYAPVVKGWSNLALPWLTLIGWVVAQVAGVPAANAAVGEFAQKPSVVHAIAIGIFNSAISKALWDGWLKPTIGGWLDHTLRRSPQSP